MAAGRWNSKWPVLRAYKADFLNRIAMPIGGIGTGTVSVGGRGQLCHWEIRNRPAKYYDPVWTGGAKPIGPFFAVRAAPADAAPQARLLEGPIPPGAYEGASGCAVLHHGLPRFQNARFAAAYPLAQVALEDGTFPLAVRLEAFNPLVPCDPERSGIPGVVLRYVIRNTGATAVDTTVCGTLVNPQEPPASGCCGGPAAPAGVPVQEVRSGGAMQGLLFRTEGGDRESENAGTLALGVLAPAEGVSRRTRWAPHRWGGSWIDFWADFLSDGRVEEPAVADPKSPVASLAVRHTIPAGGEASFTFIIGWHYPNRRSWSGEARVGNWYTTRYADAWEAVTRLAGDLPALEKETLRFVQAFCAADLPPVVKEAALFNLSTLRSTTCFRIEDGHFLGWEGCCDSVGCCAGSCTHVWNYETALPFLFGSLSRSMREVSFLHSTDEEGLMRFRTSLPLSDNAKPENRMAAADGQLGQLMRLYLDWRLCGDDAWLRKLWPAAKRAMAFCWTPGGWDADRDGVMEGCQHNTMDVEYYGPNPQMGFWYLGSLLACAEMARRMDEPEFAVTCQRLYERGRPWMMKHLFNGEYFEHKVIPPTAATRIAEGTRPSGVDMTGLAELPYQLASGCLVDQLVGQVFARLCGLEHLVPPELVVRSLKAIWTYNFKRGFHDHFNPLRSYALGDESALLMATYPRGNRPREPFPYADEVMTGFEYTAACGMLQEGLVEEGLACMAAIRERYDGRKRNPFDEAECGRHYARAMMSWTAIPALTGFQYEAPEGRLRWGAARGFHFWSTGDAWGTLETKDAADGLAVTLKVLGGRLTLKSLEVAGAGALKVGRDLKAGSTVKETIVRRK